MGASAVFQRLIASAKVLYRIYPQRMVLMILAFVAASLLDVVAVMSLVPLVMLFRDGVSTDHALGRLVTDIYGAVGIEPTILSVCLTVAGLVTMRSLLQVTAMTQIGYAAAEIGAAMRMRLVHAVLAARWSHLLTLQGGRLQAITLGEVDKAAEAAVALCKLIANVIQLSVYLALALWVSWQMTLIAVVLGGGTVWILSGFVDRVRIASREVQNRLQDLSRQIQDALGGIKTIKAMGREQVATQLIDTEVAAIRMAARQQVAGREYRANLEEPILLLALLGGALVLLQVAGSLEAVVFLLVLFERTVRRIVALQYHYEAIVVAERAFESVLETTLAAEAERETRTPGAPAVFDKAIRFADVGFAYDDRTVLEGINFDIPARSLTVLTGPSGAGKSTVIDLLLSLQAPSSGEILVDGVPLSDIDRQAWRAQVGYVPQDGLMLHDTVERNVTVGDPTLSRQDVQLALEAAGAWAFVNALPDGMDSNIGERGARLSGGERQRLMLSRALVRRPRLLVLDEATNALDARTEAAICTTLQGLARETTIVAIAHTPALAQVADAVYQITDGRMARTSPA